MAEINALDATMDLYLEEGPRAVWARHARTARVCRRGAEAMGLKLWPGNEAMAADSVTALRVPAGIEAALDSAAAES